MNFRLDAGGDLALETEGGLINLLPMALTNTGFMLRFRVSKWETKVELLGRWAEIETG